MGNLISTGIRKPVIERGLELEAIRDLGKNQKRGLSLLEGSNNRK